MENKMQFQKNAHVLASNAQEVGSLDRVVINPETKVITHIVVRMGALFNRADKIVPIDMVTDTTEDLVVLNADANTVEAMPPFEEKQVTSEVRIVEEVPTDEDQPVLLSESPAILLFTPDSAEPYTTETVQNIPEGTVAMKEGAKVISADGQHIGNVWRLHPPFDKEPIRVQPAPHLAGAEVAVVVDVIRPHHGAQLVDVQVGVARQQRVERPFDRPDANAQRVFVLG